MMIDMHSHCLPLMDDGADSIDTSLEMLRFAKANGAHTVAATPHYNCTKQSVDEFLNKREYSYSLIKETVLNAPGVYPKITFGAEVLLCSDLSEGIDLKKLCYAGTDYLLIELNSIYSPSTVSEWIYNISIRGYKPIIAHIDRYADHKDIMQELCGVDVVYQINAARFLGLFSNGAVKDILKRHDKFIVSSDMHNLTTRSFNMHIAYNKAKKYAGERLGFMFNDGAAAILNNVTL